MTQKVDLSGFVDEDQIGDWAKDAVRFAVMAKLMQGNAHNQFQPKNQAIRAEVAVVMNKLLLVK